MPAAECEEAPSHASFYRPGAAGFSWEDHPFSPHVTLARQVRLSQMPDRAALLGQPFFAPVHSMSLMLSHRVDGRLTYTPRHHRGLAMYS